VDTACPDICGEDGGGDGGGGYCPPSERSCGGDDGGDGGGGGGGGGGNAGNNFTNDDAKKAASDALSIPKCFSLIFGGTKWSTVAAAQTQLNIRPVLSSSQLPPGAPPLGPAQILGTQGNWTSDEPWGENNGSTIYVNAMYFPNDTVANINVFGTMMTAVQVFNHDHSTDFTGLQVEEAVILHELWEAAGNASRTNNPDSAANMAKLLSLCFP
jgi:hypothetical protein